jgi:hypothetical protein
MPSRITWTLAAWEDYQYWQGQDRKTLKRVNAVIRDCLRDPSLASASPNRSKKICPASGPAASTMRIALYIAWMGATW